MKKRNLGQTGTLISSIGIGAMSFSDAYGKTDTKQSHNLLSSAIDLELTISILPIYMEWGNQRKE